jgi:predicted nucleic acid-binding protein
LALTDFILCEILQGIREDAAFERTRGLLLLYPILRLERLATFEHAARLYRTCRKRGLTIRKTIDCLIAALCIEEDVELFHKDADFDAIARVASTDLSLARRSRSSRLDSASASAKGSSLDIQQRYVSIVPMPRRHPLADEGA